MESACYIYIHAEKLTYRVLQMQIYSGIFCFLTFLKECLQISVYGITHRITFSSGRKFLIAAAMVAASAAIFLCPLYIQTQCPCLTEALPKKPELIGHRGAPMVSITSNPPHTHTHTQMPMHLSSALMTGGLVQYT